MLLVYWSRVSFLAAGVSYPLSLGIHIFKPSPQRRFKQQKWEGGFPGGDVKGKRDFIPGCSCDLPCSIVPLLVVIGKGISGS